MATAPVLRSTAGKGNFQRMARLLISGGTALLGEIVDLILPPSDLPKILNNPATKNQLKSAKLTKLQWDCLYPSPGVNGKSTDFDVTLLFRLLRTICGLVPPSTGWDALPTSTDCSLAADLARIKYYRNSVYGHVNQNMEITDDEFQRLWKEIGEALVRIAGQISPAKKKEWQEDIDNCLKDPLTAEAERNVHELLRWYRNDMEIKESMEELKFSTQDVQEGVGGLATSLKGVQQGLQVIEDKAQCLETAVREEAKDIKDQLGEDLRTIKDQLGEVHQSIDRLSSSAGGPQAAGAQLPVRIDCLPSDQQVLNFIAVKVFKNVDTSKPEELNGFLQYMEKARKVLILSVQRGSLIITVECSSLEILEGLWDAYCTGHLNEMAQTFLVTDAILKEFGLIEVKLTTTILEEEYRACREYFLQSPETAVREEAKDMKDQLGKELRSTTREVREGMEHLGASFKGVQRGLEGTTQVIEDKAQCLETVVREEAKDIKDQLGEELRTTTRGNREEMEKLGTGFKAVQRELEGTTQLIRYQFGEVHQSIDRLSSSAGGPQAAGARNSKLWKKVPTVLQLWPIVGDLGDRWRELGIALNLEKAEVCNIDVDYRFSREKAHAVLLAWLEQKGRDATIGRLVVAMDQIGKKGTAQTLLEELDEAEEEGEEGHGLQQENNDELGEKSSSQILRIHEGHMHNSRDKQHSSMAKTATAKGRRARCSVNEATIRLPEIKTVQRRDDKRRETPYKRTFSYKRDFDKKDGVIYYLGKIPPPGRGWNNPAGAAVASKTGMKVQRTPGGSGKVEQLLEHFKPEPSCTGIGKNVNSWWGVDFGEKYTLLLRDYTLRHGTTDGQFVLSNWRIEGKLDGPLDSNDDWMMLKEHTNEIWDDSRSIPSPYMTKTWHIEDVNLVNRPFRYFRIVQLNKSRKNGNISFDRIYLSGMELYGDLYEK